jgi:putative sporulation protein YyaC
MKKLIDQLIKIGFNTDDYVIICIGTQRAYADSIGPSVGSAILKAFPNAIVYGSIDNNCHALNIESIIRKIKRKHSDKKILAIDACITSDGNKLGDIKVIKGSIKPGAGVGKNLPQIGDYSIKAYVLRSEHKYLLCDDLLNQHPSKDEIYTRVNNMIQKISGAIIEVQSLRSAQ